MSGAHAWNSLLAQAWGAEAPDEGAPSDLSWARGFSVRSLAHKKGPKSPLSFLTDVAEEEEDREEEDRAGPTQADLELQQILAEWGGQSGDEEQGDNELAGEASGSRLSGLDPKLERELGVRWLHEHMAAASGVAKGQEDRVPRGPDPGMTGVFAGAFRAAAREEASAQKERQEEPQRKEEKKDTSSSEPLQEAYILPVKAGHTSSAQPKVDEKSQEDKEPASAKRPETDFLNLMTAWSDVQSRQIKEGYPAGGPQLGKPPPARDRKEAPEEKRAREMRDAAQSSPVLVQLRMHLAEERASAAPPEYRSLCQRMKAAGGALRKLLPSLRSLAVESLTEVPREAAVPEAFKAPVVVKVRRTWRPKAWTQAFWSYEAGESTHRCYQRYPPFATEDEKKARRSVRVQIDDFAKYCGVLKEIDPDFSEEHGLTFPRFFVGGWCPFSYHPKAKEMWNEDWRSGRQLWAPPGVKDLSHKWVKMCCAGAGVDWEPALASLDRIQMGPAGMVIRLHVENCSAHAWYAQIQGKRAFFLFSPQQREKLYPETAWPDAWSEERCEHSPVDVLSPNEKLYPKFREAKAQLAILEPGETLVIPQGWWHYSIALESCVTLVRRFWNRSNRFGIHDEFRNFVSESEIERHGMSNMLLHHIEGCRRAIAQDDEPDDDDDPLKGD